MKIQFLVITLAFLAAQAMAAIDAFPLSESAIPEAAISEESVAVDLSWLDHEPNWALDLRFGVANYPQISWPVTTDAHLGQFFGLTYERMILREAGKAAIGASAGYFTLGETADGNGTSVQMYGVPLSLALTYRLDVYPDQAIVPFGRFGVEYSVLRYSDTVNGGSDRSGLAWTYGGGVQFLLDALDPKTAADFFGSVGVRNTYLVLEYVGTKATRESDVHLNRDFFGAAFRFEI